MTTMATATTTTSNYKMVNGNATTKPNGTLPGWQQDDEEMRRRRRRRRKGTKKAHWMSSTSLWPVGSFFFILSHFIFILLTKLFKYYLKLLMTMTEWPLPLACEPLARRVDCGLQGRRNDREEKNKEMERRKTKRWGKENKTMGEGKWNDGEGNKTTGTMARAAGKDSRGRREMEQKRGPRDVNNVSWAIGMFSLLSVLISFCFY